MASLLDSIQSSVGIVLGGATQAAQQAVIKAASATSDSVASYIGQNTNRGVNLVTSISPSSAAATPTPSVISATQPSAPLASSRNQMLLAVAGLLALYLVFKK